MTDWTQVQKIFKAYDLRGKVPGELNEDVAYRLGRVYAELFAAKQVVVGRDIRLSGEALARECIRGLLDGGCDVLNIGLCGTEMVYFSTFHLNLDGGIMITASHNPQDYNGMKLVRAGARPISGDTGLKELERRVLAGEFGLVAEKRGVVSDRDILPDYVQHLLRYVDVQKLKPLKVVVNAGNGGAGAIVDALERHLPFRFIKVNHQPDGTFPNGVPNPLLPENRRATAEVVLREQADVGIAWDGDFDRCFFFDERGEFLEGYYIVGFLATAFLKKNPGAKIIHDPRLTWNTLDIVQDLAGEAIQSKTGHAFIKERMRAEDAVYGGEMSAHHYFRDFAYCDSGMITWLLVLELLSTSGQKMSELMAERIAKYPVSGEINRELDDPKAAILRVEEKFLSDALSVDRTDGVSAEFVDWRFNLRSSNTEPVVRLNVESRGDKALMESKTKEILEVLKS